MRLVEKPELQEEQIIYRQEHTVRTNAMYLAVIAIY